MSKFWDLEILNISQLWIWDSCFVLDITEVKGFLSAVLTALENYIWIKPTATSLPRNGIPTSLDNLHDTLSTVFVGGYGRLSSSENNLQRSLWIIQSDHDIVSGKTHFFKCNVLMLRAPQTKFHFTEVEISVRANKTKTICMARRENMFFWDLDELIH